MAPPPPVTRAGECAAGEVRVAGVCEPAGLPSDMPCAPGELPSGDGACVPAGVPADRCPDGFTWAEHGCEAILPAAPCPAGQMALAGETACRAVASCAAGPYGDVPVDGDTQYVDQSFGGMPDGTAAAPWPTIQAAVDAATRGAVVAIAAGSYAEHVLVSGKSVKLWGRCPTEVEIVGPATGVGAIDVIDGAHGTEIHTLAVRGAYVGIGVSAAQNVVLDRVWVHDTGDQGLLADEVLGPASVTVDGSLVEDTAIMGMIVVGSSVTLTRSAFKNTGGRGIDILASPIGPTAALVAISDLVVEGAVGGGIVVAGSDVTVERVMVRDTSADESGRRGWGVAMFDVPGMPPTHGSVSESVVERSHDAGVIGSATEVLVDAVTVRGVGSAQGVGLQPGDGLGIIVESWEATTPLATALIRQSLVEQVEQIGVFVGASKVTMEGVRVRDAAPAPSYGWGVGIQDERSNGARAAVELRYSVVERTRDSGVFVYGSDALLEATAVLDSASGVSGSHGSALTVLDDPATGQRSVVVVTTSALERSAESGALAIGSDLTLDRSVIRDTAPNGVGSQGDGVMVMVGTSEGQLSMTRTRVEQSARAGVSCFGAGARLQDNALVCQAFALDAEPQAGRDCLLENLGGNVCGCAEPAECKAESVLLMPPPPPGVPYDPGDGP